LRTHVEAHPSSLSHGKIEERLFKSQRTKTRPKIAPKIKKMKNISAHRKRIFNQNPRTY
jgi:hypothetical protein